MASSLKKTCYRMLIEKNSETQILTPAQILRCLLVSKKLREAWSLLGIQKETKDSKVKLAKCVRKYSRCNKKLLENPERKVLVLHVE